MSFRSGGLEAVKDKAITDAVHSFSVMSSDWEHVILLSADALRADHLSSLGYDRETTPTLDELGAESLQFTNAYSASSHTREAVPSLLSGRHPDSAVDAKYRLATETIASTMSRAGYATAGFHSNPFMSRAYGFDDGFDVFDDDLHLGQHKLIALAQRALDKLRNRHYARASEINERSLNWIDDLDSDTPFFLWNHYMDTHGPYESPGEYETAYRDTPVSNSAAQELYQRAIKNPDSITEEERNCLIDLYDGEIRYLDEKIGDFLDALQDRSLLEQSLVIFTSDHGDAFGEHGYYEHPRYVHDEITHVPLLVRPPGSEAAVVDCATSTLDVVQTALSAVGRSDESLPGEDLRAIADASEGFKDRIVFSSARGEGEDSNLRRFAARSRESKCHAEYNIATEELDANCSDKTLLTALRDHVAGHVGGGAVTAAMEDESVDEEIEDRLSALGYK